MVQKSKVIKRWESLRKDLLEQVDRLYALYLLANDLYNNVDTDEFKKFQLQIWMNESEEILDSLATQIKNVDKILKELNK